jgi:hypothetical protein
MGRCDNLPGRARNATPDAEDKMRRTLAWMAPLGAALLVLGGCDLVNGIIGGKEVPLPQPVVVPPPPLPTLPTMPQMPMVPVPPPVAAPAAGQVPDFQWIDTPAVNVIPEAPLGGMANGTPFFAQSVIFEPGASSWKMIIRDQPLAAPTDIASGGQYLSIDLPTPPSAGMTWMRPMSYGEGFFQVKYDPANPEQTTSWNADNAWAIEITSWQATDWVSGGAVFQDAGRASGRIAVCYKGSANLQNSWVAGRFENAIIRYMGEPYWVKGVAAGGSASSSGGSGSSGGGKAAAEKKAGELAGKLPATPPATEPPATEPPATEPPKEEAGGGEKPALSIDVNKLKSRLDDLRKKAKEKQTE